MTEDVWRGGGWEQVKAGSDLRTHEVRWWRQCTVCSQWLFEDPLGLISSVYLALCRWWPWGRLPTPKGSSSDLDLSRNQQRFEKMIQILTRSGSGWTSQTLEIRLDQEPAYLIQGMPARDWETMVQAVRLLVPKEVFSPSLIQAFCKPCTVLLYHLEAQSNTAASGEQSGSPLFPDWQSGLLWSLPKDSPLMATERRR